MVALVALAPSAEKSDPQEMDSPELSVIHLRPCQEKCKISHPLFARVGSGKILKLFLRAVIIRSPEIPTGRSDTGLYRVPDINKVFELFLSMDIAYTEVQITFDIDRNP